MSDTPGYKDFSVSEDEAIDYYVPDSLYMLLRLSFGGQKVLEDDDSAEEDEERVRRKVLSVAQEISSGGKKWTPKHVCTCTSSGHTIERSRPFVPQSRALLEL